MPEVPPSEREPGPDETAEAAFRAPAPNDLSQLGIVLPPRAPFGQPTHEEIDIASDGSQTPTVARPAAESVPMSTTGVPHYPPPAAVPEFPRAPGPEGEAAGAVGEATGAAPTARRWAVLRPFARGLREVAETIILALLIFLLVRSVVQNFQVEGRSMQPTLESSWYLLVNKALYWEINLETVNKFIPFVDPGDDPTRYVFRGPRRGDVIVFIAPNQPERDFIKRIIAVPGETVEVRDCTVFIDGEPLDEPYLFAQSETNLAADISEMVAVLPVSDGRLFQPEYWLRIDAEQMGIVSVDVNNLTVTRAINGTTASAHKINSAVYFQNPPRYTFGPETVPPDHYFVLGDNRNNSSDSRAWGMLPKENIIGQAWLTYWPFPSFGLVDNTSVKPGDGVAQQPVGDSAAKPAPACSQS